MLKLESGINNNAQEVMLLVPAFQVCYNELKKMQLFGNVKSIINRRVNKNLLFAVYILQEG